MATPQKLPKRPRCDPIDFEAVAARQSTIKDAWRDYLRRAARPYSFHTFYRHFFRWREMQRAAQYHRASGLDALNPTADEFVESEQYWRNRSVPKTKIIALRNGASVRVQNGALVFTERLPLHLAPDGEPQVITFNEDEARRGRRSLAAPSMPRAIILPEHGWHVTAEAVKFCITHNIALYQESWGLTDVRPVSHADGRDGLGLVDEFAPGVAGGVDDVVVGLEHPV